ncbi:hypothetical protein, partial [Stenotrophomonas maltophilia]|uniref:hypothetical protein n=1 Tax=Stenotrophomonas maltophilia TaxID=40324 RepID=UPI001E4E0279
SPHPCGSRPLNRTHPAFDSGRDLLDLAGKVIENGFCRIEPCSTAVRPETQNAHQRAGVLLSDQ